MDSLSVGNLIAHALQAGLLTAGAAILARVHSGAHPQLRLALWQGVLFASVALPFIQPWHTASYEVVVSETIGATVWTGPTPGTFDPSGLLLPLLGAVFAGGVLVRVAWLGAGLWQLRRLRLAARPLDVIPEPLRAAAWRARADATFYLSDLPGPISFGLVRGRILLPRHFAALDGESQYLAALHELVHVRRRDALQCLLEECAVAILWFYPWSWWVRSRLRLAREQVVDRATAGTRSDRAAYVRTLLSFAGHQPPFLPTAAGMWRPRELRARIDALYREVSMSRTRLFAAGASVAFSLAGFAAAGAAAFPFHAPADPAITTPAPDLALQDSGQADEPVRIGGDVKPPKKIKHVDPVYPPEAKEAGIEGIVIIDAIVDKEGKVGHAEVVRSVPELDQAALDAVLQWEFEPTYIKGKAVSVRFTVTINFTLK